MLKNIFVSTLLLGLVSAECGTKPMICNDVTAKADCSGVLAGQNCFWKNESCGLKSCSDLSQEECKSIRLNGEQCYLDTNNKCQGAKACSDYSSKDTCKSLGQTKCTWNESPQDSIEYFDPYCDYTKCKDIKDVIECMKTSFNGIDCTWWGSVSTCFEDHCGMHSEDVCPTMTANSIQCHWNDNQCIEMDCVSRENCDAEVTQNLKCMSLPDQTGETVCKTVEACSDVNVEVNCLGLKFGEVECIWKDNVCVEKSCSDFLSEESCPVECYWSDGCKSCSDLNECDCDNEDQCYWLYQNGSYSCSTIICSQVSMESICKEGSCVWNKDTLTCGETYEDTQYLLINQDEIKESSDSEDSDDKSQMNKNRWMMIVIVLSLIYQ